MIAALTIRPLRAADVTVLAAILARAFKSQQSFERSLAGYLQMQTVATFVADVDGGPVGMVVGNDYGPVAYVSQMAVDPAVQRRGIGTALMDELIAWADRRRFVAIELDATASGAPLYTRYDFAQVGQTVVYGAASAGGVAGGARLFAEVDRDSLFAADARAFGADRRDVLRLLIDSPANATFVTGPRGAIDGFSIAQLRRNLLGPIVARSGPAAGWLIDAARAQLPVSHRLSVPAENCAVKALLSARSYCLERSLAHMVRGTRPAAERGEVFARINLGQG